jgi:regulatory protein
MPPMERLDGVLARVTYLPGVIPQHDASAQRGTPDPPSGDRAPSSRSSSPADVVGDDDLSRRGDDDLAPAGAARNVSITALARRGLSRRELERHLRDRGFDDVEIAADVARLERDGYLDDVALAQNLVGTLQERKGLGRSAVAAELTRRLLAPAAIEYALELIDTSDELSRAREVAVKRASQLRHLDRETAVRRLSAYLARRGYGGSTIRAAVDQALPQTPRRGVAFS